MLHSSTKRHAYVVLIQEVLHFLSLGVATHQLLAQRLTSKFIISRSLHASSSPYNGVDICVCVCVCVCLCLFVCVCVSLKKKRKKRNCRWPKTATESRVV